MDWAFAIERQREALKRVLSALVAMAGLPIAPACGGASLAGARPMLPRHLPRAVLRLLRPAEAAARRLVIAAARGLVVDLPRSRPRKPKPPPERRSKGPSLVTGIWMPPHLRPQPSRGAARAQNRALPLFDPLPRHSGKAARGVPRICLPGSGEPFPAPRERQSKGRQPLGPGDAVDAARLALRLHALGRALDDLPGQARRFARWRMRLDAAATQNRNRDAALAGGTQASRRFRRLWPLRPGHPLSVGRRAGSGSEHAVHDILRDTHALAYEVLNPDTS